MKKRKILAHYLSLLFYAVFPIFIVPVVFFIEMSIFWKIVYFIASLLILFACYRILISYSYARFYIITHINYDPDARKCADWFIRNTLDLKQKKTVQLFFLLSIPLLILSFYFFPWHPVSFIGSGLRFIICILLPLIASGIYAGLFDDFVVHEYQALLWMIYNTDTVFFRSFGLKIFIHRLAAVRPLKKEISIINQNYDSDGKFNITYSIDNEAIAIRVAVIRAFELLSKTQYNKNFPEILATLSLSDESLLKTRLIRNLTDAQKKQSIKLLTNLLRDDCATVRLVASNALTQCGWAPANDSENCWHRFAALDIAVLKQNDSRKVNELVHQFEMNKTPEVQKDLNLIKRLIEKEKTIKDFIPHNDKRQVLDQIVEKAYAELSPIDPGGKTVGATFSYKNQLIVGLSGY